jgi:hypothetical protein
MIGDATRARRVILAAAAAGLVLRIAFGLFYWTGKPLTHDEREYLALAQSIASGRGFVYDPAFETGTAQQFGRAPGYPLFLAAIGAGSADATNAPRIVQIVQSLVGALGVWLIGLLALQSAGPRAGVAAASIAAVYPPLVILPAYVLSETLFCTIALRAALALQRGLDAMDGVDDRSHRPIRQQVLIAGALTGAAVLIRPAMLFFVPFAFLWLARRRHLAAAALFALAFVVVIAPWTVRNLRTYDRFVLIASEGGVTFWTGNHALAVGEGDLAANPALKAADLEFRNAHPGLTAEALEPLYYREALAWIASHPLDWLSLELRKLFYLVVPIGPSYALHSARYQVASSVPYVLLLPLAIAGALRQGTRRPVALFLLTGSTIVMCLVFFPQERFRIPTVDPTLIVAAAALAGRSRS